jgi:uracil-DNA glycosylase
VTALRDRYLEEIGIPVWRVRAAPAVTAPASPEPAPEVAAPGALISAAPGADVWSELQATVRACTLCGLHRGRTQTVFGVGKRDARLFVIGEAPGADEDRLGEPFVGRAGQLLNAMLRSIGLPRAEV